MPQVTIQLTENEYKGLCKLATVTRTKPGEWIWTGMDSTLASLDDDVLFLTFLRDIHEHFIEGNPGEWEKALKKGLVNGKYANPLLINLL